MEIQSRHFLADLICRNVRTKNTYARYVPNVRVIFRIHQHCSLRHNYELQKIMNITELDFRQTFGSFLNLPILRPIKYLNSSVKITLLKNYFESHHNTFNEICAKRTMEIGRPCFLQPT